MGKIDAILADPHLDTKIKKRRVLISVIAPKFRVCRRSTGKEREVRKATGNSSADGSS